VAEAYSLGIGPGFGYALRIAREEWLSRMNHNRALFALMNRRNAIEAAFPDLEKKRIAKGLRGDSSHGPAGPIRRPADYEARKAELEKQYTSKRGP
jgi:hypothetical protein